jgi:hypothetical protein
MNLLVKAKFCSLMLILILLGGILCACGGPAEDTPTDAEATPTIQPGSGRADWVEVVYFHRSHRCYGCLYAEDAVTYTIETYFKDELASGELVFKVLNVEDKANAAIVNKYGAFGSSLFINEVRDGVDHIEGVTEIWFLLGDDEAVVSLVRSEIEKHLGE